MLFVQPTPVVHTKNRIQVWRNTQMEGPCGWGTLEVSIEKYRIYAEKEKISNGKSMRKNRRAL